MASEGIVLETLTLTEIWKKLQEAGELTLLIQREDEARLRKLLTKKKGRQNEKLRAAGIEPTPQTLEFETHPSTQELDKVYLHCILRENEPFKVFEVIVPSSDLF